MRRVVLIFILSQISMILNCQIIADHTVVDKYDNIPQYYIDQVKKMWLVVAGESHSLGYMSGLESLETLNSAYDVNYTSQGTPEAYTTAHLRISRATWGDLDNATGWIYDYGEEDWFTSTLAINRTKAGITYCHNNSLEISAFGFGWCYDGGYTDMTAYLGATQEYIDYCTTNGYSTKVYFTTGPVDDWNAGSNEISYLKSLAYKSIRDYVKTNATRILFDFADILCYDSGSEIPNTQTWDGHTFPIITTTNNLPAGTGHISPTGELRLAKAMWWMLARLAGWNGITTDVEKNESLKPISVFVYNDLDEIRVHASEEYLSGQLSLYNMQGFLVEKINISSDLCVFNTSSIPSGVYFVNVKKANLSETRKIVVLK